MTKTAEEKKILARQAKILLDNPAFRVLYDEYMNDKRDEFFSSDIRGVAEREALFLKVNTLADFKAYVNAAAEEMV